MVKNTKTPDVKVLADGKVMKVQKTRQRKILSCVYCHSKKIKCSRVHPTCNNCEKSGMDCQYFINDRVSKGGKNRKSLIGNEDNANFNKSLSPEDDEEQIDQLDQLEDPLQNPIIEVNLKDKSNRLDDITTNFPSLSKTLLQTQMPNFYEDQTDRAGTPSEKEDQFSFGMSSFTFANYQPQSLDIIDRHPLTPSNINNVNKNSMNQRDFNRTNEVRNERNEPFNQNISSTNISSLFVKNPPNIYPQANVQNFMDQQRQYERNGSHDFHDASQLNQLNHHRDKISDIEIEDKSDNYQPMENTNSASTATFELNHHLAHTKNFLNGTNTYYDNENLLGDLENHLPNSKKRSYELIERYVKSVHLLLPIITTFEDFEIEHNKFWEECNPYDKDLNNSMTDFNILQFYTLYFPILYASTISEFEEYDNLLLNQEIDKYLKGFNKICQYYNYPHGLKTIPLLLGNVLIQSTSPNPSTMEMSQIIRYAKFLQMNKDPVNSLKIKKYEIVKFRRLLWWTIFGLDCLTSHNFCLAPVCRFEDFNVLLPDDEEPIYNDMNEVVGYKLNVSILSMNIKFKYDRILNELVQLLYSDDSKNLSIEKMNEVNNMITEYFEYIHISINKLNLYHEKNPPKSVNENNLVNFLKNHSWSYVDRALMLLHKKYLLNDNQRMKPTKIESKQSKPIKTEMDLLDQPTIFGGEEKERRMSNSYNINLTKPTNGILSFNDFENTFQNLPEANLIRNFIHSTDFNINLTFNQNINFSYKDLSNNLVPSLLHNLNDFLKYNDFLKFGKYNWYVKRTIPLDSIIMLFIVIIVKFKHQNIKFNELLVYVKLINKSLFILNRKWFKNEKYKRMLSLTNLTWELILKKFKILHLINKFTNSNFSVISNSKNKIFNKYEYFNYQLTGYINTTELFKTMKVAQPLLSIELSNKMNDHKVRYSITSSISPIDNINNHMDLSMSIATPLPIATPNPLDFMDSAATPSTLSKIQNTLLGNFHNDEQMVVNDMNSVESNELFQIENDFIVSKELCDKFPVDHHELSLLKSKIDFDLKNNYVDINDYCAFYISLEHVLGELMRFIGP
ncbi:hypothetical protein CLIB1444_04S00716 [[Candida] jaroonii]|uniref:Uncharacterized protein n=1 Tax=[Candida] jaroonii TaxID=467808 RepID=A0ACA9Y6T0_9ASCO|nr:hypothetical protein CLIB1444_04S00716 [[Candida] jaroonii]